MKKFTVILLSTIMAIAFCACGTDEPTNDNSNPNSAVSDSTNGSVNSSESTDNISNTDNSDATGDSDNSAGKDELIYDSVDNYSCMDVDGGVAIVEFKNRQKIEYDKIIVPSEIDGKKVVSIGYRESNTPSFNAVFGSCEVVLPDSVTYIANSAFEGAPGLVRLSGGAGCEEIDEYAFINCSELKEITFLDSVEKVADNAFVGCDFFEGANN